MRRDGPPTRLRSRATSGAPGTAGGAVRGGRSTSPTCRRARCAASAAAISTSCWPIRRAGIVATDDRCPHMSAPLSIGELDGCVVACPLHEGRFDLCTGETGPDADDRRPRCRRRLPPDLVAGRSRPEGRPARQEGRGAPAHARPSAPLLPAADRRRADRDRPARATERPTPGPRRIRPGPRAAAAVTRSRSTSSGSSVTWRSSRSLASATAPCASSVSRIQSRRPGPVRPCRPARPGSGGPCRSG